MDTWYNTSGRPLSSSSWLEVHHRAKLQERKLFAQSILNRRPKRIVDLGCGPGLWLGLLNDLIPVDCEFIGVDSDSAALDEARRRSANWVRSIRFLKLNLDEDLEQLPEADTFLAFNLFPYLAKPERVLSSIKSKIVDSGTLIIRQYDGALLRFGPLDQQRRGRMEASLQASVLGSAEFRHYDLDNLFEAVASSNFKRKDLAFELFHKIAPYSREFVEYAYNTIEWIARHSGEDVSIDLEKWLAKNLTKTSQKPSYFVEVDLVGWLS
jgi:SAM-dependent methyltransferase